MFPKGTATFTQGSKTVSNISMSAGDISSVARGSRLDLGTLSPPANIIEAVDRDIGANTITLRDNFNGTTGTYSFVITYTSDGFRDAATAMRDARESLVLLTDTADVNPNPDTFAQRDTNGNVKTGEPIADDDAVSKLYLQNKLQLTTSGIISGTNAVSAGTVITTTGFTTAGDAGGAQWKATSTTGLTPSQPPADRGAAELVDGSGRLWVLTTSYGDLFAMCGAKYDGVTDDAPAVQAAFNYANTDAFTINANGGTLLLGSPVAIPSSAKGLLNGSGVDITTFKAGFQDTTVSLMDCQSRNFSMENFTLDCGATRDSGQTYCPVGLEISDRMDSSEYLQNVRVLHCRNFSFIFNEFFDTKMHTLSAFDCNWTYQHKDIYKLTVLTGTNGSTTVTSSNPVFDAGDVGKELYFGAPTGSDGGGGFITTVASVTSPTEVEVTTALPFDYSADRGMFGNVKCNGTEGNTFVTMDADGEFNLVGRRIVIPSTNKSTMYTVTGHAGNVIGLDKPLDGDVENGEIVVGASAHFINGNGGRIELDNEACLGPVMTGRLDWVIAHCKTQLQTPASAFVVGGGFHTINTNATGVVMPFYVLCGDWVTTLEIDNVYNLHEESERLGFMKLTRKNQYPKVKFYVPRSVRVGFKAFMDGYGDSRNLIVGYNGTRNGFGEDLGYYKRPYQQGIMSMQLTDDFTEVCPLANLSPDFVYGGTFIEGQSGVKVDKIQVSLQDLDYTGADSSNYYSIVLSASPRGLAEVTEYKLYQGSGDFTEETSAAFYTLTADGVSSRSKAGNKLFVSMRKTGSPPAINGGLSNASLTLIYTQD